MSRPLVDAAIEQEIMDMLSEAYNDFSQGFDLQELLARHFVRLTPEASRALAVRGLLCIVAKHPDPDERNK